jgi:penicillin-binding protein 1A
VIAGLPQAPSRLNPIADPDQALRRRNYVLRRMHETGAIDAETYRRAAAAPLTARLRGVPTEVEAPHVAEMVRAYVEQHLGEDAYASGVRVYTTLNSELQTAALRALRDTLIAYDTRHGYRGPEGRLGPAGGREAWATALGDRPTVGDLLPAVVVAVEDRSARLEAAGVGELTVHWEGLSWARRQIDADRRGPAPRRASDVVSPGDVVRVRRDGDGWRLAQVPEIQGALVAMDPKSGAIRALVGGLEFERSQFNRATQAQRQPGSSFKPFIYSAALERGYTAGSILLDEPLSRYDPGTGKTWEPENYDGKFKGPTRLREALVHSRNVPSIRLLEDIGVDYAISHGQLFGFDAQRLPRNLSLALGTGTVSPLELVGAYCVFANGGFRVEPHFIELIENEERQTLFSARPALACPSCPDAPAVGRQASEGGPAQAQPLAPRVLDPRSAWVMSSILGDVIRRGTGRAARVLERGDIAGKTGTTNDFQDAWFAGYSPTLAVTTWVGFDQLQPLGKGETGGHAALPMWVDFMRLALAGQPEAEPPPPPELRTVHIDPVTGEAVPPGQAGAIEESFPTEFAPVDPGADPYYGDYGGETGVPPGPPSPPRDTSRVTEALF